MSFDVRKFKELMVYVADKSVDDPDFGATKLNKVLFFSDFLAYGHFGVPITGADYQKLQFGPAPRQLLPIQQELERDSAAVVVPMARFTQTQRRLTALRPADLSVFSAQEIALVDEVLHSLHGHDAVDVSEMSHRWAGWQAAEIGETIPYETFWAGLPGRTPEMEQWVSEVLDRRPELAGIGSDS